MDAPKFKIRKGKMGIVVGKVWTQIDKVRIQQALNAEHEYAQTLQDSVGRLKVAGDALRHSNTTQAMREVDKLRNQFVRRLSTEEVKEVIKASKPEIELNDMSEGDTSLGTSVRV